MKAKIELFRGELAGVFAGANGYYAAAMADDGVSHYQPESGGDGWGDAALRRCNADARAMESGNWDDDEGGGR